MRPGTDGVLSEPLRVHVVGAGLAGLSAATMLAERGVPVTLYEASPHAGGRCRSYHDPVLDRRIDNGNHLFFSGNKAIRDYLRRIGGLARVRAAKRARFDFIDCQSKEQWHVDAGSGRIPWALLSEKNRPPGVSISDLFLIMKLFRKKQAQTVKGVLAKNPVAYNRLWEPLALAVLNTPLHIAHAPSLAPVLHQVFRNGARSCFPCLATDGLGETFVRPALNYLRKAGADIQFGARFTSVAFADSVAAALAISDNPVPLAKTEQVVFAVPPWIIGGTLPAVSVPGQFCGILNIHFVLPVKFEKLTVTGLINGKGHWIFVRGDVASVTISAAEKPVNQDLDGFIAVIWSEVRMALQLGDVPMMSCRLVHEKRATISHTADNLALRPGCHTPWPNVHLAGDWTDTGLPATIEGAVQSGATAASAALRYLSSQRFNDPLMRPQGTAVGPPDRGEFQAI